MNRKLTWSWNHWSAKSKGSGWSLSRLQKSDTSCAPSTKMIFLLMLQITSKWTYEQQHKISKNTYQYIYIIIYGAFVVQITIILSDVHLVWHAALSPPRAEICSVMFVLCWCVVMTLACLRKYKCNYIYSESVRIRHSLTKYASMSMIS